MNYTQTTFVNQSSPPINATWANRVDSTLAELCKGSVAKATISSSSTSSNYLLTIPGFSAAPTGTALPIALTFTPTVTNISPCYITPTWGSTAGTQCAIWDARKSAALGAGELIQGIPVTVLYDGTYFWFDGIAKCLQYGGAQNTAGYWDKGDTTPTGTTELSYNGYLIATRVRGAVWNDFAEFRSTIEDVPAGCVVVERGDDVVIRSTQRLQPGAMVVSDTYGFSIGDCRGQAAPVAVAGRVLAYTDVAREYFKVGDPVCSGENGTVSLMSREELIEYPERMIGTVSAIPPYNTWGSGQVPVNGRVWIRVR